MNCGRAQVAHDNEWADTQSPNGQKRNGREFPIDRYRGLLEAAPDAMVIVNPGGEIVLVNVQAEKQFGYRRDELVGQKVKSIIPEGCAERLIADGTRSAAEALAQQIGTGIELYGRRRDGSEFPIEIMLSPLESAEGILVTAAIRDISVRKDAETHLAQIEAGRRLTEEALRESEERYRMLLDGIQNYAIFMMDPRGGVVRWHARAHRPARTTSHTGAERRLTIFGECYLHCIARPIRKSAGIFRVQPRPQREQRVGGEVPRAVGSGSGCDGGGEPGWGDRPAECSGGETVRIQPR